MRTLLVEDDRKAARILAKGLDEKGSVVDVAGSGEEGEELAGVHDYDLIVLDWLLPGTPGIELCRRLRRRRRDADHNTDGSRCRSRSRCGSMQVRTKLFAFVELLARVRAPGGDRPLTCPRSESALSR
jgi:DNA-binding response OmpR family regulator